MASYLKDTKKRDAEVPATDYDDILEKAKKCFALAQTSTDEQRKREQSDLRFQVPEFQWDEVAKRQRQGQAVDGVPTPARPVLSISKLDQPIQLVLNQARAAKLGVNIHPVSEDADDDTAEVMQGLYRRIERDSNADQARLWALDRAVKCGRGAYRVNTKWDEDSGDTLDQEIVIEPILYQDAVYWDPSSERPDKSDADYAFVVAWWSLEKLRREYPLSRAALQGADSTSDELEWESLTQEAPEWVREDGEEKGVLVAEYWYKEHTYTSKMVRGRKYEKDDVKVCRVMMTGFEILSKDDWNGRYIPLIPVSGRELQPFDQERRYVGMIGPSKDAQRMYNYAASTLVERMAMEPKTPFIGYAGQFEGFEAQWQQANARNFPYLEVNPIIDAAKQQVLPKPERAQLDQTGMSLAVLGMQEADQWIQASTFVYDQSLGKSTRKEESGRKVLALQGQSDAATNHYLASLADISMRYEARVVLDLMPTIYDRPGRIAMILDGEDESSAVMLNAPFVPDPKTGRPMRAQEGQQGAKHFDLTKGRYSISVDIGKSFQTRLQQGGEMIGQILQSEPSLMPLIGATFFQFQDWPGAKELADILKKVRDKTYPDLAAGEEGQAPTPEQLQAQLQAAQAQNQQSQQMLQMAVQEIKTDQAKQQASIYKTQLDHQTKMAELAQKEQESLRKNATEITKAQIAAEAQGLQTDTEAQNEEMALGLEHAHQNEQADKDRAHEVAMAAAGANTMTQTVEQGQEGEQEQGSESGTKTLPPEPETSEE